MLNRGHIFINTSITEAFCIAGLEAVSAGLLVVTTNVGGTPEILPKDLLYLADPNPKSLYNKLEEAIANVESISPSENHERIKGYYSWRNIAARVEKTYYDILEEEPMSVWEKIKVVRHNSKLKIFNFLDNWICYLLISFFIDCIHRVICWIWPECSIEKVPEFNYEEYRKNPDAYGDHTENIIETD